MFAERSRIPLKTAMSCTAFLVATAVLVSAGTPDVPNKAADEAIAVGQKVPFVRSLRDLRGNRRSLRNYYRDQVLVLAFLGTDCPLANRYVPQLKRLFAHYHPRGVLFVGVYPHAYEDLDMIAAHAADRDIPFPVLKDVGQRLARRLGIERTPTVAVLDQAGILRYRGIIDDQYGVGYSRAKPTEEPLRDALDALLDGRPVPLPETESDGCLIVEDKPLRLKREVTYCRDVAPVLQRRCAPCHRPGQVAPFSLLTYQDAVRWARMIREVVLERRMPPWHADPRYGSFRNDRRMTWEEIETVVAWIDAGMPKGDEADLPEPVDYPETWTIGTPDLVLRMPEPFRVPADGVLPYQYFMVDPGFKEDRWVAAAEVRPGFRPVVHHVIVHILRPGKRLYGRDGEIATLVAWAPGDEPMVCPEGTALRIPAGSKLVFEMHYTPYGKEAVDQTEVAIRFATAPPEREIHNNLFANTRIRIPPRALHHREEAELVIPRDARIVSLFPHMHWRGKSFRYELIYPDGRRETILSVPRWDFNWQTHYTFREPLRVPAGTRLRAIAHWDNSRYNPYNPDPDAEVRWGLQTWDEMMVGWVTYVWEEPIAPQTADRRVGVTEHRRQGTSAGD